MSRERWQSRAVPVALLCAALVSLGACATRVPERPRGAAAGHQGGSSALVFDGPEVLAGLGDGAGWEATRRDGSLSRPTRVATGLDDWPESSRPSLDLARHLHLRTRARTILYLNRTDPRRPGGEDRSPMGSPYFRRPQY